MTVMLGVLVVYFVVMIGIGIWANKFNNNMTDFLLAGRRLGLGLASFTLAATYFGGGFVIGIGEMAYERGLVAWWNGLAGGIGLILVGLMAKKMRDLSLYTVPDYLAKRYGSKSIRAISSVLSLVALVGILAGQVSAARNVFAILGVDPMVGGIVAAAIFVLYTAIGGLWAATVTDFLQISIAAVGCILATVAVTIRNGGWDTINAAISQTDPPATFFNIMGGDGFTFVLWLTLPLILYTFIGQDVYQRIFASKDGKTARNSCFVAGVLICIITVFPAVMGMAARGLFPNLESAGQAIPVLISQALPPLLSGLVLAAIMAAIMSTASSILTAATSHVINDVYIELLHVGEQQDDARMLKMSRIWTLVIGALAIIFSTLVPQVVTVMLISYTLYTSGVFIPVVGGFLWKGATRQGAMAALLVGTAIAVASTAGVSFFGIPTEIFSGMVCLIVYVATSMLTKGNTIEE